MHVQLENSTLGISLPQHVFRKIAGEIVLLTRRAYSGIHKHADSHTCPSMSKAETIASRKSVRYRRCQLILTIVVRRSDLLLGCFWIAVRLLTIPFTSRTLNGTIPISFNKSKWSDSWLRFGRLSATKSTTINIPTVSHSQILSEILLFVISCPFIALLLILRNSSNFRVRFRVRNMRWYSSINRGRLNDNCCRREQSHPNPIQNIQNESASLLHFGRLSFIFPSKQSTCVWEDVSSGSSAKKYYYSVPILRILTGRWGRIHCLFLLRSFLRSGSDFANRIIRHHLNAQLRYWKITKTFYW